MHERSEVSHTIVCTPLLFNKTIKLATELKLKVFTNYLESNLQYLFDKIENNKNFQPLNIFKHFWV